MNDPRNLSPDSPDSLHEQAKACRRLANDARTQSGKSSLRALADHFDGMANKLEADAEVGESRAGRDQG